MTPEVGFRLVVSPGTGRLRFLPPRRFESGREVVVRGQAVARIERGGEHLTLHSPVGGRVATVLGLEGEPVVAGRPIMAIEPSGGEA